MLPVTPDDVELRVAWLGITGDQLTRGDKGNALLVRGHRTGRQLQELTRAQLNSLRDLWPGLAEVGVNLDALPKVDLHQTDAGNPIGALEADTEYECIIEVSSAMLEAAGCDTNNVRWFATQRGLVHNASLPTSTTPDDGTPISFVVGDGHINLAGPRLSLRSVSALSEHGDAGAEASEGTQASPADPDVPPMVVGGPAPMHPSLFELHGTVGWDEPSAMYLVDAAVRSALSHWGTYTEVFDDRESVTVFLRAGGNPPVHIVHGASTAVDEWDAAVASGAVTALCQWLYLEAPGATRRWTAERLGLLREAIARTVVDSPPARRYVAVRGALGSVLTQAESTWAAFVSGALDKHSAAVDALDSAIDTASSEFARTSGDIATRVVATMLSTAAVVIGVFVAAALDVELSQTALDAALLTYAGYLLLFPGLIGLLNSWVDYRATDLRLAKATRRGALVLGHDAVTENGKSPLLVHRGRQRFRMTFVIAALVYGAVAGTLALVAVDAIELPAPVDVPTPGTPSP